MFYMYVLFTPSGDRYYVGSTRDLKTRYESHVRKANFATKRFSDWKLIYYEAYVARSLAFRREQSLKKRGKAWQELKKRMIESKR